MTDDIITISAGAPPTNLTPGVYEVTLTDISEPRTIYPQSGPKSKTYAWLTALLGGTPPAVGQSYPKSQLVGRLALATISIDAGGWAKIVNLSAMPRQAAPAAAPVAAAPVAAPARPVAEQPVASTDQLPF